MKKYNNVASLVLLLFTFGVVVTPCVAENAGNGDEWNSSISVYLWGAGIDGKTQTGSDLDISFNDIISELDFALMGTFEARKGKWAFIGDIVYLDITADKGGTVPAPDGAVGVEADIALDGLVITLLGGYNLSNSGNTTADFIFGARYFDLNTKFNVSAAGSPVLEESQSGDVIDVVIGLQGKLGLSEKWFVPYYIDVGTGQSVSTVQAMGGIGYGYNWGELQLLYRYLSWKLDSDSAIDNINFSGPVLGVAFNF